MLAKQGLLFSFVFRRSCAPNLKILEAKSKKYSGAPFDQYYEVIFDSLKVLKGLFFFYICKGSFSTLFKVSSFYVKFKNVYYKLFSKF